MCWDDAARARLPGPGPGARRAVRHTCRRRGAAGSGGSRPAGRAGRPDRSWRSASTTRPGATWRRWPSGRRPPAGSRSRAPRGDGGLGAPDPPAGRTARRGRRRPPDRPAPRLDDPAAAAARAPSRRPGSHRLRTTPRSSAATATAAGLRCPWSSRRRPVLRSSATATGPTATCSPSGARSPGSSTGRRRTWATRCGSWPGPPGARRARTGGRPTPWSSGYGADPAAVRAWFPVHAAELWLWFADAGPPAYLTQLTADLEAGRRRPGGRRPLNAVRGRAPCAGPAGG